MYREDIAGLRGIAVLAVVLFHINENWLPGGFLGVDIFFVLSGFLITQNINKSIVDNSFSITEFYIGRIKRILPAMFVMVFVVLVFSLLFMLPTDAEKVAESSISSVLSMANVYYWLFQDVGYFASSSKEIPLLHLWSLGVEEQFYVFFPLLLLLSKKWYSSLIGIGAMFGLVLLSSTLGQLYFSESPSFTYYMLPTRAGELLVGAIFALLLFRFKDVDYKYRSLVGNAACIVLIFCLVSYDESMVFPGFAALAPTLATGVILFNGLGERNLYRDFIINKGMLFLGTISYSLYLWHWPVLAFYRYGLPTENTYVGVLLFFLMVILGWISYKLVETPFRFAKISKRKTVINLMIVPSLLIIFISLVSMKTDGTILQVAMKEKFSQRDELINKRAASYNYRSICQVNTPDEEFLVRDDCVINSNKEDAIMFGDSNASHYVGLISEIVGFNFRNAALGGCPVVLGDISKATSIKRLDDCNKGVPKLLSKALTYDRVIYSLSWSDYKKRDESFFNKVEDTIKLFSSKGKKVLVIGKVNVFDEYNRHCDSRAVYYPFYMDCYVEPRPIVHYVDEVNEELRNITERIDGVGFVDPNIALCNGECSMYGKNGESLYYDRSHLSFEGSSLLGEELKKLFELQHSEVK